MKHRYVANVMICNAAVPRMIWVGFLLLAAAGSPGAAAADWQDIVTDEDKSRLARLEDAIKEGDRTAAASNPAPKDRAALRAVLDPPDLPLDEAALVGDWKCRTIKVGEILVVYSRFRCRISRTDRGLFLEKRSGSQRFSGYLYPDTGHRAHLILLGGATVNDEPQVSYSTQAGDGDSGSPDSDLIGVLSRSGSNSLRIVFPWPRYESIYDVMELTR